MGKIICGNCLEEMEKLEENSVDSVVTDPPYALAFMGKTGTPSSRKNTRNSRGSGASER